LLLHCTAAAKAAFSAFDKKSEERIKVGDIESTMKKLGHSIKSGWLEKIESTIDTEGYHFTVCSIKLNRRKRDFLWGRFFLIKVDDFF